MGLRGFENHGFFQSFAERFIRLKSRPFSCLVELLNMCLLLGCRVDAVLHTHRCAYVPCLALQNSIRSCIRSTPYGALREKLRLVRRAIGRSTVAVKLYDSAWRHVDGVYGTANKVLSRSAWMLHKFTVYLSGNKHIYVSVPCTLYVPYTCTHAMQNHKKATIPVYTPTTDSFVDRLDRCSLYPASICTYVGLSNVA